MSAGGPRAVRIARPTDRPPPAARPGPSSAEAGSAPRLPPTGNRAGLRRARRLLMVYLLAILAALTAILLLFATSPYAPIRQDLAAYAFLSALAAISAVTGYFLTIGRAPWAAYAEEGYLVVRERLGPVRRFPIDENLAVRVVSRSYGSFMSPEPTEVIRVRSGRAPAREYVVAEGELSEMSELADALSGR